MEGRVNYKNRSARKIRKNWKEHNILHLCIERQIENTARGSRPAVPPRSLERCLQVTSTVQNLILTPDLIELELPDCLSAKFGFDSTVSI